MPLHNQHITAETNAGPLFYAANFLPVFGVFGLLGVFGMIQFFRQKKLSPTVELFLGIFFVFYLVFMSVVVGEKYLRFFLPILPVLLWFAARGFLYISKVIRNKASIVLLFLLLFSLIGVEAADGVAEVLSQHEATTPLMQAASYLNSLDTDAVFCSSFSHCFYVGNVYPINYTVTWEEFTQLQEEKELTYALLDNYHNEPAYVDLLLNNTILFEQRNEYKYAMVLALP